MKDINLQIYKFRKAKGITQEELANQLGVTYQAVSKWETGAAFPDITLLPQIADYFNESVDSILGLMPAKMGKHELYQPIKDCLMNVEKDEIANIAWNLSAVLHEGMASEGWSNHVNWNTKENRLKIDGGGYSGWGLSLQCDSKGFTHMTSGLTIIGSMDDIHIPTSDDAIKIARLFEVFQDKYFIKLLVECYNKIKEKGVNEPITREEIIAFSTNSLENIDAFILKMTSMGLLLESFSPDGNDIEYLMNKALMIIPIIILGDMFANKLNMV